MLPLVVAWAALGELSLLALAAWFPRHVFAIGPRSPWIALSCLLLVYLLTGPEKLHAAGAAASKELARRRRFLLGATALVLGASALVGAYFPAGVDVELLHPDGSHQPIGPRGEFDLGAHEVLALATYPLATVHMTGHFSPGLTVPWAEKPPNVRTKWHVSARGAFRLELNAHNAVDFDNASLPTSGAELIADLAPRVDAIDLKFQPADTFGDGRMTVALEDVRLPWHLFRRSVSTASVWFICGLRLLLAATIVLCVPALGTWGVAMLGARLRRVASVLPWIPFLKEALVVCLAGALYVFALAPRVQVSASGDQGAVLAWVDYLERRQVVQPVPEWAHRWAGNHPATYVALSMHLPHAGTSNPETADAALVDEKPIGLPLIALVSRAVFGEKSVYFVSAGMAAVAVVTLYAAARVTGMGILLSLLGAASLAGDRAFLHGAALLDPDVPTTAFASVLLLALLLVRRGNGWAAIAGASCGWACLTRYNAFLMLLLAVPFLLRTPRRILPFALGGAPFLAVLLGINAVTYGHPLAFPYLTFVRQHMAGALPYFTELAGYLRAFVSDLSPVAWLPFLAFPFVRSFPVVQRVALTLFVVGWFAFFGNIGKAEPFFLRYLLPTYPAIILGSLHVWRRLMQTAMASRHGVLGGAVTLAAAWILPRALDEEPIPPDTSRVAAAWVDYEVPPSAAILTDGSLNGAVYHYTGHRRFPVSLQVPRRQDADLAMLKRTARGAGDTEDWFLLVPRWEMNDFQANYPELRLELIHTGPAWRLYRIVSIEGAE